MGMSPFDAHLSQTPSHPNSAISTSPSIDRYGSDLPTTIAAATATAVVVVFAVVVAALGDASLPTAGARVYATFLPRFGAVAQLTWRRPRQPHAQLAVLRGVPQLLAPISRGLHGAVGSWQTGRKKVAPMVARLRGSLALGY
eukprot:CAMPEP_0185572582 /NCGR_PEP_ID=MMETSP0434-20130131/4486_1 /TAXON_ID=626734 ORGANISM="Favella taraikaensis, Strain Fe Narragansett Bay" /NCGR_SAMPLE_ID=MMETSP0434 /ASSEMBLY_ACC=CAM_ASM_000379 /LENGTH=141 /DNA_ID=CAMNT_0028188523 /DNA_START=2622 /DNA_END=3048 /DNA_ORIENTATION=-